MLKPLMVGLRVSENYGGTLFWGPYEKDPIC